MTESTTAALTRIAHAKASAGDGWSALTAQLAADALAVASVMAEQPAALLDLSPLRGLHLPEEDTVLDAVSAVRTGLLASAVVWGLTPAIRDALPPLDLPPVRLHPESGWSFAFERLGGTGPADYLARTTVRAGRLYALGSRLLGQGDALGAIRSLRAADIDTFTAHHTRAAIEARDPYLAALHTATLLADQALPALPTPGTEPAQTVHAVRQALDWATMTDTAVDWPEIPALT